MLIKVTFDLADPAGIMYFANVYHLAHKNIEHWLESEFKLWQTWFNNPEYGAPIKHSHCDYHKPMILGNDYRVKSSVKSIGESSVVLSTLFLNEDKSLCAEVETVHVFVNKKSMQKINVPVDIKQKISSLL